MLDAATEPAVGTSCRGTDASATDMDAHLDLGADLRECQADAAVWRPFERVPFKSQVGQNAQRRASKGGSVGSVRSGMEGLGAGALGKQLNILRMDAVSHAARGAVQVLVQGAGTGFFGTQRDGDQPGIREWHPWPDAWPRK